MSKYPSPSELRELPSTAQSDIPESYLDQMGHMNVMWYTHLFSRAVWGLFNLIDFTEEYMKANGAGSFALELHVRYLREVHAGQHVTLRTRALARSAKRIHYLHFLTIDEQDGALSALGEIVSAHVDLNVRRQAPFPDHIAAKFDALLEAHRRLTWEAPVCGTMKA
jgi:acyl-CoA thioester hydrolase